MIALPAYVPPATARVYRNITPAPFLAIWQNAIK